MPERSKKTEIDLENDGNGCAPWFFGLAAWGLVALWYYQTPEPEVIEHYYARGIYRLIVGTLTPITSQVEFSIATYLVIGLPALFFFLWACVWLWRRFRGEPHWRGLLWGVKWGFLIAPFIILWFLLFWGMGYQRPPIEERLGLGELVIADEEASLLRQQLLAVIQRDAPDTPEDRDVERAIAAVAAAMRATIEEWDGRPVVLPDRVKATRPGLLLLNGTSGMCVPLTLEPHVDGGLPDTAFVSVAAHELGHIAGICSEAEANLIGYVAGLRADDPYARYAVALRMYPQLLSGLPPEAVKTAIDILPDVAKADIAAARAAAMRYRIEWVRKASWRVYDKYLQSQGVKEGVKSYDRGITLFAQLWRQGRADYHGVEGPASPAQADTPDEVGPPDETAPPDDEPAEDSETKDTGEASEAAAS